MTHHVTICIVHNDEVIFLGSDSFNQFILHFVSTHFRFQVISSYFRRRNQDTVFLIIRSFTSTIEEEGYVCVFFSFCNMQLSLSVICQIFSQSILNVFLVEQDMYALERSIIRSHAIVLQTRNCMHALFRHILLSQNDSQLFRTVVTIVEEDHYIAFLDGSVETAVYNRLDEFVGYTFIVRFLHGLYHVGSNLTLTVNQQIVSFLHTFPTFVAVHCIETSYDRSDTSGRLCTVSSQLFDEAFSALRVCITSVHETVDESSVLQTVFLSNVAKFEQMIK